MPWSRIAGLCSLTLAALATAYLIGSVWFCAMSLNGDLGGCVAMVSGGFFGSTIAQIGSVAAAIGFLVAFRGGR